MDANLTAQDKELREKSGRLMHESWSGTKRAQGFHGPHEACTASKVVNGATLGSSACFQDKDFYQEWHRCIRFHADLIPWEDLPQKQKDINYNAFDLVWPLIQRHVALLVAGAYEAAAKFIEDVGMAESLGRHISGSCGVDEAVTTADKIANMLRSRTPADARAAQEEHDKEVAERAKSEEYKEVLKLGDVLGEVISQFDWGRAWYSDGQSEQNEKKVVKALTNARAVHAEFCAAYPKDTATPERGEGETR